MGFRDDRLFLVDIGAAERIFREMVQTMVLVSVVGFSTGFALTMVL